MVGYLEAGIAGYLKMDIVDYLGGTVDHSEDTAGCLEDIVGH
jgi:hypothetical protein